MPQGDGVFCEEKNPPRTMFIKLHLSSHPVCLPTSGLLLFMFFFLISFSLQAVETNLASKDSHWVFVNEVRAPEW